jgi:hypothetical protein
MISPSRTVWPMTARSDANRDCHTSYPITTTGAAPTRSSASAIHRPKSGGTRASRKPEAVISAMRTHSAGRPSTISRRSMV